ncbi:MAG TPA: dihydrolipoamide acetyltransferase family protein [Solirubrobacterales bacterium]|nr:dihydrolipoamide acetyltransferase family protein [Solirubrobacterales bacterium]
MAFDFHLPDVFEGTATAEIVEWKVAVGDEVKEDQPLVDVETDKAVVTIPCPTDGVVLELRGELGETMPVGELLAVFGERGELAQAGAGAAEPVEASAAEAHPTRETAALAGAPAAPREGAGQGNGAPVSPVEAASAAALAAGRPLASPAVRKLARERGVDLASVTGSGPAGRIVREDVLAAAGPQAPPAREAEAPAPAAAPARGDEVIPLRGIRRTIARNMTESWQTVPHIVDFRDVDATALLAARRDLRARAEADGDEELAKVLTMMPLLAKIAATAALRHPGVNSSVDMEREQITRHGAVHLSVATSTSDGLLTPVVRDADRRSVTEIAREIAALAAAARSRSLSREQLTGGTLTVNNYGALGSSLSTPIIPPGQSANLGFGRLQERALVRDGELDAAPVLGLSCSGDHRVLDGADLASFVNDVVAAIENPVLLLAELA